MNEDNRTNSFSNESEVSGAREVEDETDLIDVVGFSDEDDGDGDDDDDRSLEIKSESAEKNFPVEDKSTQFRFFTCNPFDAQHQHYQQYKRLSNELLLQTHRYHLCSHPFHFNALGNSTYECPILTPWLSPLWWPLLPWQLTYSKNEINGHDDVITSCPRDRPLGEMQKILHDLPKKFSQTSSHFYGNIGRCRTNESDCNRHPADKGFCQFCSGAARIREKLSSRKTNYLDVSSVNSSSSSSSPSTDSRRGKSSHHVTSSAPHQQATKFNNITSQRLRTLVRKKFNPQNNNGNNNNKDHFSSGLLLNDRLETSKDKHPGSIDSVSFASRQPICPICRRCFSSSSALEIHQRTHSGVKPYTCTTCGKAFSTKGNLKVHSSAVHRPNAGRGRRGQRLSLSPERLRAILEVFHKSKCNGRRF